MDSVLAGALSSRILPLSASMNIAVPVKAFATEPAAYTVLGVAGIFFSRSAQPNASSQTIRPF